MNFKNIFNGWTNLIKSRTIGLAESIEDQALIRSSICNNCELFNRNVCDNKQFTKHVITGEEINGCGCPIPAKTMSQYDHCPAGKWNEMLAPDLWEHVINLSEYDKINVKANNSYTMYYNQKDYGIFVSRDGNVSLTYQYMAQMANKQNLLTCVIISALDLFKVNEETNVFIIPESVIKYINQMVNYDEVIVWIPKVLMPHIKLEAFLMKCEMACLHIAANTNKQVSYVYGISNDVTPLKSVIELRGIYKHGSVIPKTLKDQL